MPKKYEAIRDKCLEQGGKKDQCQSKAAAIYNSQRKPGQKPVGPAYHRKASKGR